MTTAEQIVQLRERSTKAITEVARQEAVVEASDAALAEAEKVVRDAGLDLDGDLDAQVAELEQATTTELEGVEGELAALTAESEAPNGN